MKLRTVVRNGHIITEQVTENRDSFSIRSPIKPRKTIMMKDNFTAHVDQNRVYELHGSSETLGLTGTLPPPSDTPGCIMTFRAASKHVHKLTCSLQVPNMKGFSIDGTLASTISLGSTLSIGASISFISDGRRYVMFASTEKIVIFEPP